MTDDYFEIDNDRENSDEDDDDFKAIDEANNLMYLDQLEIGDG